MHVFIAFMVGLVVGGVLSYAFRGKEHAALQSAGSAVGGVIGGGGPGSVGGGVGEKK